MQMHSGCDPDVTLIQVRLYIPILYFTRLKEDFYLQYKKLT